MEDEEKFKGGQVTVQAGAAQRCWGEGFLCPQSLKHLVTVP